MNKRAKELGLKYTSFENATGLDDTTTNHYSCAADIATISRELIKYEIILKYSSTWQDSIRDGEFTLTNTNRLVRYYEGCNGLKTGSTDKAGYCVSATAKRGNMQLIAVIMGAETREKRNEAARRLLDFGFANYALYEVPESFIENVNVLSGVDRAVPISSTEFCAVVEKGKLSEIEKVYEIPEYISAPISAKDKVGKIIYKINGEQIGFSDIIVTESVARIGVSGIFFEILKRFMFG
jgi:D-alanyl-D-alanine carboxypeptidase (penicillin-binding protein 5/6)